AKRPSIEVGCFAYMGSPNDSRRKEMEVLARFAQRRIAQTLSSGARFSVKMAASPAVWCPTLSFDVSPHVAAIVSGEWSIEGDAIQLRPVVKVLNPGSLKSAPLLAVFLRPVTRPLASALAISEEYASRVKSFLFAITDEDGWFPDIRSSQLE